MDQARQDRQLTGPPSRSTIAVPASARGGLPAGVEELLVGVVADGFTVYCCGPKAAPTALLACYEWLEWVDLLTIRDFDRVTTARIPTQGRTVDIFAPEIVVWAYEGPPQQALRALLNLVHPAHPEAPTVGYPAPAGLRIPRAQQRPMTIQPPTAGRAGVRSARLATAMRTPGRHRATLSAATAEDRRLAAGWSERPPTLAPGGQPVTTSLAVSGGPCSPQRR